MKHKKEEWQGFEISESEAKELLKHPKDFAWFGENGEMFNTWALGPVICRRDSPLIDQSNKEILMQWLAEIPEFKGKYELTSCNHWLVGYVDHLSFQVFDVGGNPSNVAKFILFHLDQIKEVYPILDEDHFSNLEHDEFEKGLASDIKRLANRFDVEITEDQENKIYELVRDKNPNYDSQGIPYVDETDLEEAFQEIGITTEERAEQ